MGCISTYQRRARDFGIGSLGIRDPIKEYLTTRYRESKPLSSSCRELQVGKTRPCRGGHTRDLVAAVRRCCPSLSASRRCLSAVCAVAHANLATPCEPAAGAAGSARSSSVRSSAAHVARCSDQPPRQLRLALRLCSVVQDRCATRRVCRSAHAAHPFLVRPASLHLPPLAGRAAELDRVIAEYTVDAVAELGALRASFTDRDHAWVRQYAAMSLAEIEKATLRIVALRTSRNLSRAAARLEMAPVSLASWIDRRTLRPVLAVP